MSGYVRISSNDPDATEKLNERLKRLEEARAKLREEHGVLRTKRAHIPAWKMKNLTENIRGVKKRIKQLSQDKP